MAVAQVPPPVHGAAVVNAAMCRAFVERGMALTVHNVASGKLRRNALHHFRRLGRYLAAYGRAGGRHYSALYLSCEAGAGLLYQFPLAALFRLQRKQIVVHHHSFAYLDRRRRSFRLFTDVLGARTVHVALCEAMADQLRRYTGVNNVLVLNNAHALAEPARRKERPKTNTDPSEPRPLMIGMLSNLSIEKGIHTFVEVIHALNAVGINSRGVLAGPAADEVAEAMLSKLDEHSPHGQLVEWRGPLYGPEKDAFWAELDLFLFPSKYRNEAQPLVVLESLQKGVPVISSSIGCLGEMHPLIQALSPGPAFVAAAVNVIRQGDQRKGDVLPVATTLDDLRRAAQSSIDQIAVLLDTACHPRSGSPVRSG